MKRALLIATGAIVAFNLAVAGYVWLKPDAQHVLTLQFFDLDKQEKKVRLCDLIVNTSCVAPSYAVCEVQLKSLDNGVLRAALPRLPPRDNPEAYWLACIKAPPLNTTSPGVLTSLGPVPVPLWIMRVDYERAPGKEEQTEHMCRLNDQVPCKFPSMESCMARLRKIDPESVRLTLRDTHGGVARDYSYGFSCAKVLAFKEFPPPLTEPTIVIKP